MRTLPLLCIALALAVGCLGRPAAARPAPAWSAAGELSEPRAFAKAAALETGEILVVGGLSSASDRPVAARAELFDPRTGRARSIPTVGARVWQTVTPLRSGLVLMAGGVAWEGEWQPTSRADLFDPWTGRWFGAAPLRQARSDHGAALLPDGRVMVAGGNEGPRLLRSVEIYDPVRDAWSEAPPLPLARTQHTMAALPDGRVLVAGGREGPGAVSSTAVLWDPRTASWTAGPALSVARSLHASVVLPNGDVLLLGGGHAAAGNAERFVSKEDRFVYAGTFARPRLLSDAAVLPDGRVVIAGGIASPNFGGFDALASVEVWSPETNRWDELAPMRLSRVMGVVVASEEGLFFLGGATAEQVPQGSIEVFR